MSVQWDQQAAPAGLLDLVPSPYTADQCLFDGIDN